MNIHIAYKKLIIILALTIFSANSWAVTYNYHADVKGMVCAFCAYTVSKNILSLPGVNEDSINVDLVDGAVTFTSDKKVTENKLSSIFSQSGFTLSNLTFKKNKKYTANVKNEVVLDMTLDLFKASELAIIIEAIGQYATNSISRVVLEAPASAEKTILGPLLMGRQEVIKISFTPTDSDKIHLQLFDNAN